MVVGSVEMVDSNTSNTTCVCTGVFDPLHGGGGFCNIVLTVNNNNTLIAQSGLKKACFFPILCCNISVQAN